MGNLNGLDLTNVEVKDFSPMPEGTYDFVIHDVKIAESKAGNRMIKTEYKVINHDLYKGKMVFDCFVTNHEVGLQRLKSLANAIGISPILDDTNDFIGGKFRGTITLETDSYGDKNKMKKTVAMSKTEVATPEVKTEDSKNTPW